MLCCRFILIKSPRQIRRSESLLDGELLHLRVAFLFNRRQGQCPNVRQYFGRSNLKEELNIVRFPRRGNGKYTVCRTSKLGLKTTRGRLPPFGYA